jgi:DNA-binding response OmpR family regulator
MMKSILLVDNEIEVAEALQRTLCHYGFHAEIADSNLAAQRWAGKTEFDIILIEFNLAPAKPLSNEAGAAYYGSACGRGTALIRELRAAKVTSLIVVYSVLRGELYETAALDAGADDYVVKGPYISVLLSRLYAHIRRRENDLGLAAKADRRTPIGRYTLDRKNRTLLADDITVQISPREGTLLEVLAASPSRVVSTTQLLDEVWGEDLHRSPLALTALIKRIRRKMEKNGLADPIENVRGGGYKLSTSTQHRFVAR